jgi:hypothetical protein
VESRYRNEICPTCGIEMIQVREITKKLKLDNVREILILNDFNFIEMPIGVFNFGLVIYHADTNEFINLADFKKDKGFNKLIQMLNSKKVNEMIKS